MVIMHSTDYDKKMLALLDSPYYQELNKDPTATFQRKNNTIVSRLLNLNLIDKRTANQLRTTAATCPSIYGQPKAHKPDLPLRPVVPNITAPTYNLSKMIADILKPSIKSKYSIKDSFEFVEYINKITLPPCYVLVSFDVVSLFTNIPMDLVMHDIIENWDNISKHTNINLDMFLEITEFCITSSYFRFRDKYFRQVFGSAMGSPLSPILAELVLENLVNTVTRNLAFEIPVLRKFVDDFILALPEKQIAQTLDAFNNYNEHLQFTMESETENKLPFLDTLVIRNEDQSISTEWYTKQISSGRLLNYFSFHPISMKLNVASNFIKRVTQITTNKALNLQKHTIRQHLRQNNYPTGLINRLLNNIRKITTPPASPHTPPSSTAQNIPESEDDHNPAQTSNQQIVNANCSQPQQQHSKIYRSIPCIPQLSSAITRTIAPDYPQIQLTHRPIVTTQSMLRPVKDPVPPSQKSCVIYSIPCSECQQVYVGMTRNQLKTRLSGHRSNLKKYASLLETRPTNPHADYEISHLMDKTALIEHAIQQKHSFDLTTTKILDHTYRASALPILEMCHITNTPHTVNRRTDVDGLSTTYAGLLHTIKNIISLPKKNIREELSLSQGSFPNHTIQSNPSTSL